MVWFLLGLLFIAAGLYLGFGYGLAFGYFVIGCLCCVFGVTIFVLQLQERPSKPAATRLSSKFISAGSTVMMPAMPSAANDQAAEQPAVE